MFWKKVSYNNEIQDDSKCLTSFFITFPMLSQSCLIENEEIYRFYVVMLCFSKTFCTVYNIFRHEIYLLVLYFCVPLCNLYLQIFVFLLKLQNKSSTFSQKQSLK